MSLTITSSDNLINPGRIVYGKVYDDDDGTGIIVSSSSRNSVYVPYIDVTTSGFLDPSDGPSRPLTIYGDFIMYDRSYGNPQNYVCVQYFDENTGLWVTKSTHTVSAQGVFHIDCYYTNKDTTLRVSRNDSRELRILLQQYNDWFYNQRAPLYFLPDGKTFSAASKDYFSVRDNRNLQYSIQRITAHNGLIRPHLAYYTHYVVA